MIKLRIILWVILAGVVGWLLYMGVAPSGKISYTYDFTKPNYFIEKLTPKERVKPIVCDKETEFPRGNSVSDAIFCSQVIIGDPVYFSLHTPRRFDEAMLTLKYRRQEIASPAGDPISIPLIEAGVLVDKIVWRYDLKPIENKIIDQLSLVWGETREGDTVLLQRDISTTSEPIKKYNSIQNFLDNLLASPKLGGPEINEIATYNYNLDTEYLLPDYKPSDEENKINYALRGPFQFYTYVKDEKLDFTFNFQDLNKNKDSDEINLYLYYNNQLIDSRHFDDDGVSENNNKITDRGEMKLKLANLPEGVYKIEIKTNDDIVTKSIKTKQQKLSFINKVWIYDSGNENIELYSDSSAINAQTINPANLQTIEINDDELEISETYKQFSIKIKGDIKKIKLQKDDVILSGNGVFSFNKESLISPEIKKVDVNMDIANENINYILANYNYPREEGEWKTAKAQFDLSKAYRENGKYSFLISVPGLKADDEIDDFIEISEIKINLQGTSLWEKLGLKK